MTSVERIFPTAQALLCLFHVLMAVDRRLDKAKLPHDRHIEIYRRFEEAVYCDTEDELEEAAWELCNIGSFSIVSIFNDSLNYLINYN